MGSKGPVLTLLGGAVLASVLVALSVHASAGNRQQQKAAGQQSAVTASPSVAPSPSATSPSTKPKASVAPAANRATYAGYTKPGGAMVAIAIRDGVAIAYLCDGRDVEAWLKGTATGGKLDLTGNHGARLTATYAKGSMSGTITVSGKHWTFTARAVYPPSGLYKATAIVRNAKVEAGWIVYNGRQVGIATVDGTPGPASTLNTDTQTATVNGETINATPVDGATGTGF